MHVPDGFLDLPTSLATGVAAAGVATVALRRSRNELDERTVPLAGLTAAFVFAVQMLNFPVGIGTSGHLMGGALAAVLVGPWTAVLCMSVVLTTQALLFADGGLTALGTNLILMGAVTVAVGWSVTRVALAVLPKRAGSVVPAAFLGGLVSVPAAASVFVALYAVGGAVELSIGALLASMVGWHVLIGIGEALITAATVGAVVAVRPDLVYAARVVRPQLRLRAADGSLVDVPVAPTVEPVGLTGQARGKRSAPSGRSILLGGGLATLVVAGVVSSFASSSPDGLEFVAGERGFLQTAADHVLGDFALADYGEVGGIPVGVAGVIGVAVVIGIAFLVLRFIDGSRSGRQLRSPERV